MFYTYTTEDGTPLLYTYKPFPGTKILSAPNSGKWYDLYLIDENGKVSRCGKDLGIELQDALGALRDKDPLAKEAAFLDHTFNPAAVQMYCEWKGYSLCDRTLEVLIGRWEREYREKNYLTYVQTAG